MKTTGNWSSHEGCNPEWEREEAYRNEWQHSAWGDELWDEGAYYKVKDLLNTALWDEETKHDFWINWDSAVFERELTMLMCRKRFNISTSINHVCLLVK